MLITRCSSYLAVLVDTHTNNSEVVEEEQTIVILAAPAVPSQVEQWLLGYTCTHYLRFTR